EHGTSYDNSKYDDYCIEHESDFIGLLDNLKTVKIYNFMDNLKVVESTTLEEFLEWLQYKIKFLRYLLKNSKVLERMIIRIRENVKFLDMSKTTKLELLLQLTQELLAFPRASTDVEISLI
ncbi:hypothetical protein U1Q18_001451, partial [Sarracenia purpurea var. burkii]